jgi:hypothetical protein
MCLWSAELQGMGACASPSLIKGIIHHKIRNLKSNGIRVTIGQHARETSPVVYGIVDCSRFAISPGFAQAEQESRPKG